MDDIRVNNATTTTMAALVIGAAFVVGVVWGARGGVLAAWQLPSPQPPSPAPVTTPTPASATPSTATADASNDESDDDADVPPPPIVQDPTRIFTTRTGVILNYLKAGQGTAFERTMKRVGEALMASDDPDRRRQAVGWRVFQAEDPLDGGVLLYISVLDPTVPGADYWVPGILNEAFPTEVQELYDDYSSAFADGQILLNLMPILPQ
ncbi:MAG: hypothetical protein VYE68_00980 [Acidobacteriota bacterium]|nr:hypothetical protein [Acidobacteriota bacterium]